MVNDFNNKFALGSQGLRSCRKQKPLLVSYEQQLVKILQQLSVNTH